MVNLSYERKLRIANIIISSHIAYYVKEYLVFCSHNIAISAGRDRLLMQINAYLDFNPFSLGFLGSNFPKE